MTKNKKLLIGIGIVALLGIVSVGVYRNLHKEVDDCMLRVGVILPLTGDWASFGKQMENGIKLWEMEHPNSGIKIVVDDGKGRAAESLTTLNKDLWQSHIRTYISGFSAAILGMAPVIVKNNAFLVNAGATNPKIKEFGKNVFTLIPDADIEAEFLARFVAESLKEGKCFIYHQNDDSGKGLSDVFEKTYEKLGGNVCGREPIQSDMEIANVLQKIRLMGIKVVFIPANGAYVAKIIRQAQNLDLTEITWVGYAGTETPDLAHLLVGLNSVKLIFSTYAFSNSAMHDENTKAFIENYQKTYGEKPAYYAATCYDAIDIIYRAYGICKNEDEVAKTIQCMKSYAGVSGQYEINGKNYVSSGISLKMFYKGEILPYSEISTDERR